MAAKPVGSSEVNLVRSSLELSISITGPAQTSKSSSLPPPSSPNLDIHSR